MEAERQRVAPIKPMGNPRHETEKGVTFLKSFSHLLAGAYVILSPVPFVKCID